MENPSASQNAVHPLQDKIRGCLFGGAVGDALGYPIEFMSLTSIRLSYGADGLRRYALRDGLARISDDTQMSLFTADGLLSAAREGLADAPESCVWHSYQNWLKTQEYAFGDPNMPAEADSPLFLMRIPALFARRAPGITCLSALRSTDSAHQYAENNSKGCGGVMRVAPVALQAFARQAESRLADECAANIARLTHAHPLGYMPAAMLAHILGGLLRPMGLRAALCEAWAAMEELYAENEYLPALLEITDRAAALAENARSDEENIAALGQGWVAEEALAIALYCALHYEDDFSLGIIAAVNHDGDSDSTGAIAGNLLGAIHGHEAIAPEWKQNLELADVILEAADALFRQ